VRGDKQKAAGKREKGYDEIAESKERKQQEREEGRTSEEGTNVFRKNSRTGRSPSRSEEGNKSKEMKIREENKVLKK
jgi:hypothetical protein